jgi:hypothetical protein
MILQGKYSEDSSKYIFRRGACSISSSHIRLSRCRFVFHTVSEDVREGKRPIHADLIASKREELYDWVEERSMLITGIHPSQNKKMYETEDEPELRN